MPSSAPAALPPPNTRAEASRVNGARSRGPKTAKGKAHAARNAVKHGLRAAKFAVVAGEDREAFDALESILVDELAPSGALQSLLACRIARAVWRLERAERIEGDLLGCHAADGNLGLALIRDGNGTRAFDTLLRYRGTALAELWRSLRLLKALQAETLVHDAAPESALVLTSLLNADQPNEPEARRIPSEITPSAANEPERTPLAVYAQTGWVAANPK